MEDHLKEWKCVGKHGKTTRKVFSEEMDVRKMVPRKAGSGEERPKVVRTGSMGPPAVPSRSSGGGSSKAPQKYGSSTKRS
jgi:hypothetical protein